MMNGVTTLSRPQASEMEDSRGTLCRNRRLFGALERLRCGWAGQDREGGPVVVCSVSYEPIAGPVGNSGNLLIFARRLGIEIEVEGTRFERALFSPLSLLTG